MPVALTVALTGATLTTVEYQTGRASLQDQLAKRGAQLAGDLALSARLGILSDDQPSLRELAHAATREPDVLYVIFASAEGKTLARAGRAPTGISVPRSIGPRSRPTLSLRTEGPHRSCDALAPVVVERAGSRTTTEDDLFRLDGGTGTARAEPVEIAGFAQVGLSFRETDRRMQSALVQSIAIGTLWGILGIAAVAVVAGMVTRRLRRVMHVSHRMAEGQLDVRVPAARTGDELNDLALHFNRMADALAQRDEIFRANEELRAQNESIQRASALKSAFLATMSHELRTPLSAIVGFTRLVLRKSAEELAPKQLENLRKVEVSALGLLDLINGMLDLSKIEAGHMALAGEQVDLGQIATGVVDELAPLVQAKPVLLRAIVAPGQPTTWTDSTRVRQILTNLVSNAIKFTARGEVTVTVLYEPGAERHVLSVHDTGIGIPEGERERIFEPFHQIDGSATRSFGGTGLGLAIVRDLSILLGGTVDVESTVGGGSTFTVRLPHRAAPLAAPSGQDSAPDQGRSADVA